MHIVEIVRQIRALGIRRSVNTARYALRRDSLERRYRVQPAEAERQTPGEVLGLEAFHGGCRFRFTHGALEASFLAPDLARLTWEGGEAPIPYALARQDWPMHAVDCLESDGVITLSTPEIELKVDKDGGLCFSRPGGPALFEALPPERSGQAWRQAARLQGDDHFFGLGERAAPFNLRGGSFRMWNSDAHGSYGPGADPIYICIPVYVGLHSGGSYLVFYENPFPATFRMGGAAESGTAEATGAGEQLVEADFEGGMLRYYLVPGPVQRALDRYSELTGRASLPPYWVFGYHQSRWGYKTEADVRRVVQGFKDRDLPLDAFHLDIDYMDGCRAFTVDRRRFPDLKELAGELQAGGIRLVTIVDPAVKLDRKYFLYQEGLQGVHFCCLPDGNLAQGIVWPGWSVYPDFTRAETRRWWGRQYARLLGEGVAGFWHDMNEPAALAAWGDLTLPLAVRHELEGQGCDQRQAHNLYGLLMDQAAFEALREIHPDRRPWLLTRSGWAGVQRYAWNWTGDIQSTWEALRQTIATLLGLGLSGLPFNGADIGGFSGDPSGELYLRWLQMATFTPFMRTHSAITSRHGEPWDFGEPYTSLARECLKLRRRLGPYLYTLGWEAAHSGHPLIRPLFWNHEHEKRLWEVQDAFLLGEALLIAPVLEAGADSRVVRLPPGRWYDFWDGRLIDEGEQATLTCGLERIPVLVRAGSLLPLLEADHLALHLYSPLEGESRSLLYSDVGDGYGDWRLDHYRISRDRDRMEILQSSEGDYAYPYKSTCLYVHGMQARRAVVDGREAAIAEGRLEAGEFERLEVWGESLGK